jgi:hypothetical protein
MFDIGCLDNPFGVECLYFLPRPHKTFYIKNQNLSNQKNKLAQNIEISYPDLLNFHAPSLYVFSSIDIILHQNKKRLRGKNLRSVDFIVVPKAGVEPARPKASDFELRP